METDKRDSSNPRRQFGVIFNSKTMKYEKKHKSELKESDNVIGIYITEKGQNNICQSLNTFKNL